MEELINWITSLDLSVIYTAVVGFAATWGGSIIALVVALIKQRARNFNYKEALAKVEIKLSESETAKIEELKASLLTSLDKVSKDLLSAQNEQSKARLEAINSISQDVNEAAKELNETFSVEDAVKELN